MLYYIHIYVKAVIYEQAVFLMRTSTKTQFGEKCIHISKSIAVYVEATLSHSPLPSLLVSGVSYFSFRTI